MLSRQGATSPITSKINLRGKISTGLDDGFTSVIMSIKLLREIGEKSQSDERLGYDTSVNELETNIADGMPVIFPTKITFFGTPKLSNP